MAWRLFALTLALLFLLQSAVPSAQAMYYDIQQAITDHAFAVGMASIVAVLLVVALVRLRNEIRRKDQ
jgi:hypothetical protein